MDWAIIIVWMFCGVLVGVGLQSRGETDQERAGNKWAGNATPAAVESCITNVGIGDTQVGSQDLTQVHMFIQM